MKVIQEPSKPVTADKQQVAPIVAKEVGVPTATQNATDQPEDMEFQVQKAKSWGKKKLATIQEEGHSQIYEDSEKIERLLR